MKCKVCSREAQQQGYCSLHWVAFRNVKEGFLVWQKAADVNWVVYLREIQKNSLTGEWAKDVVKQLLWEEENDVK
jgi:hypothetical protein